MKNVLSLILMLIMCGAVSAEPTYFMEQKSSCFNVDLGSTTYVHHDDNATFMNVNPSVPQYYGDNQIISVIGVEGSSQETVLDFVFTGTDWYYILNGTDTRYRRPFGIDLVVRVNVGTDGKIDHQTYSKVVHLGRQASGTGDIAASVTLPQTDGKKKFNGKKIKAAWLDVVLVMDPFVNTETGLISENGVDITDASNTKYGYVIGSDDIYTTSFKVDVRNTGESFLFNMNGYYQRKSPGVSDDGFSSIVSVFPNANATSFDVKSLKADNSSLSSETVIGGYNFTTNSKTSNNKFDVNSAKVYFFASSSPNGSVSGDKFVLKYVSPISGVTVSNLNKFNSVTYEIGLKGVSKITKWFDGTDKFGTIDLYQDALQATTLVERASNRDMWTIRVFDDGEILLRIIGDVDDLSAGRYRSDIYFHVVTDW